jgi:hypothetical protein
MITGMIIRFSQYLACLCALLALLGCNNSHVQWVYVTVTESEVRDIDAIPDGSSTETEARIDFDIQIQVISNIYSPAAFLYWSNREAGSRDGIREKNFATGWSAFQSDLRDVLKSECDVSMPDQGELQPNDFANELEQVLTDVGFRTHQVFDGADESWTRQDGTRNYRVRHTAMTRTAN